jgi:formate hydrogenlyase transcriptional activator
VDLRIIEYRHISYRDVPLNDEYEFYRGATARICGSLRVDQALHDALLYLRQYMPVDKVFLQFFRANLKAMNTVAIATKEGGLSVDQLVPFSDDALREMAAFEREFLQQKKGFVWLFQDEIDEIEMCRLYFGFHEADVSSLIVMPLNLADKVVGAGGIYLVTEGEETFTTHHAQLVSSLKEPFALAMANALRHREVLRLKDRLADDNQYLSRELQRISGDEIIGADFGLRETMQQVHKVAATDTPVLLLGETGVGKDVIANAIHRGSSRSGGPFIPVNCGAIPDSLIDSELFGHEKGAFTGALARKRGRFERADKGTILLDEIGEMPLEAQVRLLRVLQQREIERVGGTSSIQVDIRIIAATNKDLKQMVTDGRFREDLWYRLNVFPIVVPPLRERRMDIAALVHHFLERKAKDLKIGVTPELAAGAMEALLEYSWHGNVRELENVIERAMILHQGEPLRFEGLEPVSAAHTAPVMGVTDPVMGVTDPETLELDSVVAEHIRRVLDKTGGKVHGPQGAGELLGVNPSTLRARMRKLGILVKK